MKFRLYIVAVVLVFGGLLSSCEKDLPLTMRNDQPSLRGSENPNSNPDDVNDDSEEDVPVVITDPGGDDDDESPNK